MYDDLLGPKRPFHAGARHKRKIQNTYWKKVSSVQADTPTRNGRVYPKHVLKDALAQKIPEKNYRKNFFLVSSAPQDPTTVNLKDVIGFVLAYKFRGNEILLEIQYINGREPYSQFDIDLCCLGSVDATGRVMSPLTITQVYMI